MTLRLAIDTGGTFTDSVLQDADSGELWFSKTLSDPQRPQQAVEEGVEELRRQHPFSLTDVEQVLLATTVCTNAILERKGARTALITTKGFRDVLIMGRAKRYDTYNLHLDKPRPLVQRRHILEVDERVGADGEVITSLDEASVDQVMEAIAELELEAVAVSLLHAYANPQHEEVIGQRLRRLNRDLPVSLSSQVSPKYREYERTSTTIANAYVTPLARRFLEGIEQAFEAEDFQGEIFVMQSNGGLLAPSIAKTYPVNLIESGPAAGVLLGGVIGQQVHRARILTFDMGGTTAKVGDIEDGEVAVSATLEVDAINLRQWSGLPLNISAVELIEIGAGGGSIASVGMGLIRVGPESAGADPGPVCYGRGGEQTTITDANAVLGYLTPDGFAGGKINLDAESAERALKQQIAEPLNLSVQEAAWGVHAIANANMEQVLRSMSIERGRDPRDYTLVAFGGAGPMHAARLARSLGIRQVIVPRGAGVGSAIGMLAAKPQLAIALTRILPVEPGELQATAKIYAELEQRAQEMVGQKPLAGWRRHAHLRYRGQGYELRVELPQGEIRTGYVEKTLERFHRAYREAYGYDQPDQPVEATDWYLTAISESTHEHPAIYRTRVRPRAEIARRSAYFPELNGMVECDIHDGQALSVDSVVRGPALIADPDSTTLVLPGDIVTVHQTGHICIEISSEG